nr:hypothetical protein Iba_chr11aCG11890 [Ipomoea batatas]
MKIYKCAKLSSAKIQVTIEVESGGVRSGTCEKSRHLRSLSGFFVLRSLVQSSKEILEKSGVGWLFVMDSISLNQTIDTIANDVVDGMPGFDSTSNKGPQAQLDGALGSCCLLARLLLSWTRRSREFVDQVPPLALPLGVRLQEPWLLFDLVRVIAPSF